MLLISHFENTALASICVNAQSVQHILRNSQHGNTFKLAPGVPAFLVKEGVAQGDWQNLGDENFYLIDMDITEPWLNLMAGAILKFTSGHSITVNGTDESLKCYGTAEDPVILDSEAGTPGTWGGIYLNGGFDIKHAIIRNGGEFVLPNATEKANIVTAVTDDLEPLYRMSYTTISNSAGYGLVYESGAFDYEYEDAKFNNTFENNSQGDVLRK